MYMIVGKILSTVLLNMAGKLLTEKFMSKLISILVLDALKYLRAKDLIKGSNLDTEVIDVLVEQLEGKP